jgi:uncharacterized protein (DUF1697 family)
MATLIVLLRAIGPVTHRLMSMQQWRNAALDAGFGRAETYVATGNMILETDLAPELVTLRMNDILAGFGLGPNVSAFVRSPESLARLIEANPFRDAADLRPDALAACFFAGPPDLAWLSSHRGDERVHPVGDHLIVDYPMHISKAKLVPAKIERWSGTAMTARNWNTVRNLLARSTS